MTDNLFPEVPAPDETTVTESPCGCRTDEPCEDHADDFLEFHVNLLNVVRALGPFADRRWRENPAIREDFRHFVQTAFTAATSAPIWSAAA